MPRIILTISLIILVGAIIAFKLGYFPQTFTPTLSSPGVAGLNGLIFSSKDDERRIKSLDSCINNMFSSGWQNHEDYKEIGNFYEASWCNGMCYTGPLVPAKKAKHQVKLFTTEYKLPQVSGVGLEINVIPDKPGWGVNFSLVNDVFASITNDRFQINFLKYQDPNTESTEEVSMGLNNLVYQIYDTKISVDSGDSIETSLVSYTASAQNLRDLSLKEQEKLNQLVVDKINSNSISHCLAVKRRDPLPPECIKEGILNDQEKAAELKKADEYFSAQKKMVNSDYLVMYDVLMKALPIKSCLFTGLVAISKTPSVAITDFHDVQLIYLTNNGSLPPPDHRELTLTIYESAKGVISGTQETRDYNKVLEKKSFATPASEKQFEELVNLALVLKSSPNASKGCPGSSTQQVKIMKADKTLFEISADSCGSNSTYKNLSEFISKVNQELQLIERGEKINFF